MVGARPSRALQQFVNPYSDEKEIPARARLSRGLRQVGGWACDGSKEVNQTQGIRYKNVEYTYNTSSGSPVNLKASECLSLPYYT